VEVDEMQRNPKVLAIIVLIMLIGISACQNNSSTAYTDCTHHIISAQGDFQSICSMDVSDGASQAEIELDFHLTSGRINWVLRDPYGEMWLEGQADYEDAVIEEHTLKDPAPGIWLFEFSLEDAEGEYNTYWNVQ
jgi:hypothetical protein